MEDPWRRKHAIVLKSESNKMLGNKKAQQKIDGEPLVEEKKEVEEEKEKIAIKALPPWRSKRITLVRLDEQLQLVGKVARLQSGKLKKWEPKIVYPEVIWTNDPTFEWEVKAMNFEWRIIVDSSVRQTLPKGRTDFLLPKPRAQYKTLSIEDWDRIRKERVEARLVFVMPYKKGFGKAVEFETANASYKMGSMKGHMRSLG